MVYLGPYSSSPAVESLDVMLLYSRLAIWELNDGGPWPPLRFLDAGGA